MRISRTLAGATAVAAVLAAAMAGTASADTNTTVGTALAAIGSDTTDDVVEGLSALATLNQDLANYKTVPIGRSIDTSANYAGSAGRPAGADCVTAAPRGSGEGRSGLAASMLGTGVTFAADPANNSANYTECAGFGRSSSSGFPSGVPSGSVARLPLGVDAIAPAVLKSGTVPKKLSFTLLKSLYTRNGVAGSSACFNLVPLVPSFTSGTRGSFAGMLGITDYDFSGTGGTIQAPPANPATITWGSCVTGGAARAGQTGTGAGNGNPGDRKGGPTGTVIQEHDGRFLDGSNQVLGYSVAQWGVQGSQVVADIRGGSVLASVDFETTTNTVTDANLRHPFALNGQNTPSVGFRGTQGNMTRTVYNLVPRTLIDPAYTSAPAQVGFVPAAQGGDVQAADVARFQQAFVGPTSDACQAAATVLLYGFAIAPDCGAVTYNP